MKQRRRTTTSNFGVGARESHDATPFYDRALLRVAWELLAARARDGVASPR